MTTKAAAKYGLLKVRSEGSGLGARSTGPGLLPRTAAPPVTQNSCGSWDFDRFWMILAQVCLINPGISWLI